MCSSVQYNQGIQPRYNNSISECNAMNVSNLIYIYTFTILVNALTGMTSSSAAALPSATQVAQSAAAVAFPKHLTSYFQHLNYLYNRIM